MVTKLEENLKVRVGKLLRKQGYKVNKSSFNLRDEERETKRAVHSLAKAERIASREDFIRRKIPFIRNLLIDGSQLNVNKIKPRIIEVQADSKWEILFRWCNLVWWSLPYEHAYGRQMRFVIWDTYHKSVIGLIGLQSPILSWSVRDNYLGIIKQKRDFWVNQSLSAQRLGALPPYNDILGGKLIAYLMTSDVIRKKFENKYEDKKTLLKKRKIPARLLFLTTTGAYGKSSVYTRLKYHNEYVAKFIGYTYGSGSFHITNSMYEDLVRHLGNEGYDVSRGYGNGPSRKLRIIDKALEELGFKDGANHGVKRAVYLFPLAKNLTKVIQSNAKPQWFHRTVKDLTEFWKERWAIPRSQRNSTYLDFSVEEFITQTLVDLEKYKELSNKIAKI
jgi:hypothetical protein